MKGRRQTADGRQQKADSKRQKEKSKKRNEEFHAEAQRGKDAEKYMECCFCLCRDDNIEMIG